ncbi:MAG: cytochrome-c oxidase, cbb3-type subunit III [Pseudomonadales bacterium]|nr:cytochrome-c oxidase, cbb3-type subunit III [Pseudomonadales bacterium]
MADLPSGFWSGWIMVVTLVSLAAVAWLTYSLYFSADAEEQPEVEPVWDNDLREGSKAPPMWWFWLLFAALIFTLVYLMLYPGLGSFTGFLNWSQGSRVAESYENFELNFADVRDEISSMSLVEMQNDLALMDTAERIFARECAACHGPDGRGQASLFPNLHDVDWQWGASAEQIEQSIRNGRQAQMIAWEALLGAEGVQQVSEYVLSLGTEGSENHPGKPAYDQNCVACHGIDGAGNPLLGAPRITDDIWLYGGDLESIKTTVREGRFGIMPAFGERLDELQIKLLVALLAR